MDDKARKRFKRLKRLNRGKPTAKTAKQGKQCKSKPFKPAMRCKPAIDNGISHYTCHYNKDAHKFTGSEKDTAKDSKEKDEVMI